MTYTDTCAGHRGACAPKNGLEIRFLVPEIFNKYKRSIFFGTPCNDDDTKKIIMISLSVAFVLLLGIFLIFIFLRKKKVKEEEPEMEKNEVYGEEDEYYDEHDNRVEDSNDYYES